MKDGGYGNSAMPVYQEFVRSAISLNPDYISVLDHFLWVKTISF